MDHGAVLCEDGEMLLVITGRREVSGGASVGPEA